MSNTGNGYTESNYGNNDITVLKYIENIAGGTIEHVLNYSSSLAICESGQNYLDGSPIVFTAFFQKQSDVKQSLMCTFSVPYFFHLVFDKHQMGGAFREHALNSDIKDIVANFIRYDNTLLKTTATIDPANNNITLYMDIDFGKDMKSITQEVSAFLSAVKKAELTLYMLDKKFGMSQGLTPDKLRIKPRIR